MGFEMKREVKGDTEDLGHSNWKDGVFPMDSGVTVGRAVFASQESVFR